MSLIFFVVYGHHMRCASSIDLVLQWRSRYAFKKHHKERRYQKKYKNIPTALSPSQISEVDAIAKVENMTRSEIIRRSVDAFVFNYKTDRLDQRQLQLERRMKVMESAIRTLLVKAIRLNGQVLYFVTFPWTMGFPKQRINDEGFKMLYEKSAMFAAQFLKSKATGLALEDLNKNKEVTE